MGWDDLVGPHLAIPEVGTLHPTHNAHRTLHPAPHTPCTPHPAPCTLHPFTLPPPCLLLPACLPAQVLSCVDEAVYQEVRSYLENNAQG